MVIILGVIPFQEEKLLEVMFLVPVDTNAVSYNVSYHRETDESG